MTLTPNELEFLAAWAREEQTPACYQLPAHRLQLAHGVSGALLIVFIKAWTKAEHRKDHEILSASNNETPAWPWTNDAHFQSRLKEARDERAVREIPAA